MQEKKFFGTITEVLASFHEDGSLDEQYVRDFTEFQIESGINGLFVNGLTPSETLCLSTEEKIELGRIVCSQTAGRVPVMCNIMTNSYRDGLKMVDAFTSFGCDAICATPPMIYRMSPDAMYEFFSRIIKASSLPMYIYNQPQSGNPMPPELIARISKDHDNLVGYKDSTNDATHLQILITKTKDKPLNILTGSDSTIYTALTLGCQGGISYLSAIFPELMLKITDAYFSGDIEGAYKAQLKAIEVRDLLKKYPARSAYRYASKLTGHPMGYSRLPDALFRLSPEQEKSVEAGLKNLGVI